MTVYELLHRVADDLALLKRFGWRGYRGLYDYCKGAEEYIRSTMCHLDADILNTEIDIHEQGNRRAE